MSEANQTIVGRTVTIKGEIIGDEPLTVEGRVEGRIALQSTIHVKESGFVKADISSQSITVAGGISGNIEASDKVEILKGGFMVGDIKAPRIVINDGANLKGQVDMEIDEEQLVAQQRAGAAGAAGSNGSTPPVSRLSNDSRDDSEEEAIEAGVGADEVESKNGSSFFGRK